MKKYLSYFQLFFKGKISYAALGMTPLNICQQSSNQPFNILNFYFRKLNFLTRSIAKPTSLGCSISKGLGLVEHLQRI